MRTWRKKGFLAATLWFIMRMAWRASQSDSNSRSEPPWVVMVCYMGMGGVWVRGVRGVRRSNSRSDPPWEGNCIVRCMGGWVIGFASLVVG